MGLGIFSSSMSVVESHIEESLQADVQATERKTCLNCETQLDGEFCHICGQPASTEKYSLKTLFQEIYAQLRKFEATKTMKTFGALMSRPGGFVNDFLAGKRVSFIGPVRYLFYAIFIEITIKLFVSQFFPGAVSIGVGQSTLMAELTNLGLSVIWGLCWAVVFWKAEMNLVEYTVAAIYFAGHLSFLSAILTAVFILVPASVVDSHANYAFVDLAVTFVYSFFFAWGVFGERWWSTILKQMVAFAGFAAAYTLISSYITFG